MIDRKNQTKYSPHTIHPPSSFVKRVTILFRYHFVIKIGCFGLDNVGGLC